jgi:hypothetical protein
LENSKEYLHRLADNLPEARIPEAIRFLEFLQTMDDEIESFDYRTSSAGKGEHFYCSGKEKSAAETGWQEYLNGKSKSLEQLIKEQLYVEAE